MDHFRRPIVLLADQIIRRITSVFPFSKIEPLSITELPGYIGRNYLFKGTLNEATSVSNNISNKFVLKVFKKNPIDGVQKEILQVLQYLQQKGFNCLCPIETVEGQLYDTVSAEEITDGQSAVGEWYDLIVHNFINGEMMINVFKTPKLYYLYGHTLGRLNHLLLNSVSIKVYAFIYQLLL